MGKHGQKINHSDQKKLDVKKNMLYDYIYLMF